MSAAYRRLAHSLQITGLVVLLLVAVAPAATSEVSAQPTSGQIAVFKFICDRVGQQDTCNGRDTSLDGYLIQFAVRAGTDTSGPGVLQTINVTINDNAQGNGNTGGGSQGRAVGDQLPLGTYTVCEIPQATRTGFPTVELVGYPRPTASQGGSTGGSNQYQNGDFCITVNLTPGVAELKFLNTRVTPPPAQPSSTPTLLPVSSATRIPTSTNTTLPGVNTSTATTVPVNSSTATTVPSNSPTATIVPGGTSTATSVPTVTATATFIPTITGTAPTASPTIAGTSLLPLFVPGPGFSSPGGGIFPSNPQPSGGQITTTGGGVTAPASVPAPAAVVAPAAPAAAPPVTGGVLGEFQPPAEVAVAPPAPELPVVAPMVEVAGEVVTMPAPQVAGVSAPAAQISQPIADRLPRTGSPAPVQPWALLGLTMTIGGLALRYLGRRNSGE